MKPTNDKKLDILNDHYKTTVAGFKQTAKSRDTNFVIVLLLLGAMAFQVVAPQQSQTVLTQIINSHLGSGIDAAYSVNLLGSLIWLILFFALMRYFQAVINLEKEYNYSHELEDQLSSYYERRAFTKEGVSYLSNYAYFSSWLHIIYRYVFPVALLLLLSIKIIGEWSVWSGQHHSGVALPQTLDSIIYIFLLISILLYVFSLRNTKKDSEKDVEKNS